MPSDNHDPQLPGERRGSECSVRLATQFAVARLLASHRSLDEVAPAALREICQRLNWDQGTIWQADPQGGCIRCTHTWPPEHDDAVASDTSPSAWGVGLPWRVWIGTRPVWIENLASSPDHQASTGAAFTNGSGFAVPIASPQHTIGAIQFLSKARRPTDPHILELAKSLALQLAQFIKWHRTHESLQRSEAKLRALL